MVIVLVVVLLITLNSLGVAFKEASRLPFENIHSSIIIRSWVRVTENHRQNQMPQIHFRSK